jgi:hypothetical protein
MPLADEWDTVQPRLPAADAALLDATHDVALAVGGCGCASSAFWCGQQSIDTLRNRRTCGDAPQLHVCLLNGTNGRRRSRLQQLDDQRAAAVAAARDAAEAARDAAADAARDAAAAAASRAAAAAGGERRMLRQW